MNAEVVPAVEVMRVLESAFDAVLPDVSSDGRVVFCAAVLDALMTEQLIVVRGITRRYPS